MPPREPLWYCHECNAEMRPLMTPDPHCASCNGTFVEKLDNPEDDPRHIHGVGGGDDEMDGLQAFGLLAGLSDLLRGPGGAAGHTPGGRRASDPSNHTGSSTSSTPGVSRESSTGFRFEFGGPDGGRRTVIIGGDNVLGRRDGSGSQQGSGPPPLSDFFRAGNASNRSDASDASTNSIPGNLMAQYLISMLGGGMRGGPMFMPMPFGMMGDEHGGPAEGRWGDYVFSQDALDQIITQIMEAGNASRPVPAPEEMIKNLPRDVLVEGSPLLGEDCAVCKEQFSTTADPAEQIVVTLPCKHPFHVDCIEPWLKSSGTCPVCRYALVAQPTQQPGAGGAGAGPSGSSSTSSGSPPPPPPSSSRPGDSSSSGGSGTDAGGTGNRTPFPFPSSPEPGWDSSQRNNSNNNDSAGGSNARSNTGNPMHDFRNLFSQLDGRANFTTTTTTTNTTTQPGQPTRTQSHTHTHTHSHTNSRSRSPDDARTRRDRGQQQGGDNSGNNGRGNGGGGGGFNSHGIMDRIHSLFTSATHPLSHSHTHDTSSTSSNNNSNSNSANSSSSPRRRGSQSPRGNDRDRDDLPGSWN